ncbi:MAG: hypothetical protein WBF42_06905, partial [Terracidiphilus sp.]
AYECAKAREAEYRSRLERQEAYFAQSQVLEFIQSKRHTIAPLTVAMGMAGLPGVTSRTSYDRCSLLAGLPNPGPAYEVFQSFYRIFARQDLTMDEGLERLKALALAGRAKNASPLQEELRRNWHFVECAALSVLRRRQYLRAELPFRIFAEYRRRSEIQSQYEILMKQVKELVR